MKKHEPDDTTDLDDEPQTAAESEAGANDAETQRDEYLAALQRSQADYQNLRRRLQSDIDAAVGRAKGPLLQDLLLVLDYLDMALAVPVTGAEGKNLHAGVEMTRGQLVRALDREGVKPVADSGPFDASVHDAVESVATDDVPPNSIVATQSKGYTMKGAVLRPAQVKVAVAPGGGAQTGGADADRTKARGATTGDAEEPDAGSRRSDAGRAGADGADERRENG
jgi:molecular chaperone GrpE